MHVNISTTISARGFTTTAALKDYIGRRLNFAFDRYAARIRRVQVRLSDINGPRGGSDKRCKLVVEMADRPAIVVEDTSADLYMAIDRSIGRAVQTVGRNVDRGRDHGRSRTQPEMEQPEQEQPEVEQPEHEQSMELESVQAPSASERLDSLDDERLARTG